MILIENISVVGLEPTIRGMRNPMNSWDKSDSGLTCPHGEYRMGMELCSECVKKGCDDTPYFAVGENDHELMMNLAKGGPVHAKYRRMIIAYMDITAPLYWWKEFDTYKVGTVANSCSTMHKIHAKEFVRDDFSCEHLTNYGAWDGEHGFREDSASYAHAKIMGLVIESLNGARDRYLDYKSRGKDWEETTKQAWWQMIQLLPSSYNQRRTIMASYEVLAAIDVHRDGHKLDEWGDFRRMIRSLPYSEVITGGV